MTLLGPRALAVASAVSLAACGGTSSPPPSPVGARVAPALAAALSAFDRARVPWRCAAADGPRPTAETLTVGDATWKVEDATLTRDQTGNAPVAIGVVADAGGAAKPTLAALAKLRGQLGDVDLVIALGGMGANDKQLEATLGVLAETGGHAPVIAIAGDLESMSELEVAIAKLRTKNRVVFDARRIREIRIADLTIATVPGAATGARLAAGADGCSYSSEDFARITEQLSARPGLRVLATAEAPREMIDGEPVGELAIVPAAGRVDVQLHAPITPRVSRARTGKRDGAATPLSPGTSDATTRLPGPRHTPSAGVLTWNRPRGAWSWRAVTTE